MRLVRKAVQDGWPESHSGIQSSIEMYWTFRKDVTYILKDCSSKKSKLLVPTKRVKKLEKNLWGVYRNSNEEDIYTFLAGNGKKKTNWARCEGNVQEIQKNNKIRECEDYYSKHPEISKSSGATSKHHYSFEADLRMTWRTWWTLFRQRKTTDKWCRHSQPAGS